MYGGNWKGYVDTKKGKRWVRETAQCFCLVNLQKSDFGDQFYVNLGAFVKQLDPQVAAPLEHHRHYRIRLTSLLPNKIPLERSLDVENGGDEEERLRTISAALRDYGVGWLKSMETLEGIRERLAGGTEADSAVSVRLKTLLGVG